MRRLGWLAVLGVAAVSLAGAVFLGYRAGLVYFAYPSLSHPTGIDVSHHQGDVDWIRLNRSKVAFAYIKASEGGDLRDQAFRANAAGAAAAGIPAGAYHYFTLCRSGADQAVNFLATIGETGLDLQPTVDLEYGGNCTARPDPNAFGRELSAFLSALETGGYKPILYSTQRFYADYLNRPPFNDYPLWLRDIVSPLSPPAGSRVVIWQFANRARLDGISGPVDRNAIMGEIADLGIRR